MSHLVFVLPGYDPTKPTTHGALSPYHRTGTLVLTDGVEPDVVIRLAEPVAKSDALWPTLPHIVTYADDDAAVEVVIKCRDIIGAYAYPDLPLADAVNRYGPTADLMPLAFGVGAKLCVRVQNDKPTTVVSVAGLHHSVPQLKGSWYEVVCTEPSWNGPLSSPFVKRLANAGHYLIDPVIIEYGCNPVPGHPATMPSIRNQLRNTTWRDLRFFRVGNVIQRETSQHKDGNETYNFSGYFQLRASGDNESAHIRLEPTFMPYDGDEAVKTRYDQNTHMLPLWRYYCGFTEAVEGNPLVDKSDDPAVQQLEPRGHYFDTRNYAELDFNSGTLELEPRYLRQGYPLAQPGDWVCGIVGTNRVGSCLTKWFICSDALKQLIEFVQQADASAPDAATVRTNSYLDALQARIGREPAEAWAALFNESVIPVRTETTSRPVSRDVYQTLLTLLVTDEAGGTDAALDDDVHDVDAFRVLVYYKWWIWHQRPQARGRVLGRLARFVAG